MTYDSYLFFAAYALIVLGIYLLFPLKYRWTVLLGAGALFCGFLNGPVALWVLACAGFAYVSARHLTTLQDRFAKEKKDLSKDERKALKARYTRRKKWTAAGGIVGALSILLVLKYCNFFIGQINPLLSLFGVTEGIPFLSLALPMGISYYTLQAIGYIIDTYRGVCRAEKNFFKLLLFVSFFPQMTEGPIARYGQLAPQLTEGHRYSNENFTGGVTLILWGFFKKIVISDRASFMASEVFDNSASYGTFALITAAVLYTVQLYTDFSGCIDIMSGTARMFGIRLPENFRQPFFSHSVGEFWRRWHISLGTWFKDYVFYSVSLSAPFMKLSKAASAKLNKFLAALLPSSCALLIVWLGTGLWHGADMKYVVYGLYYFLIMFLGSLVDPLGAKAAQKWGFDRKKGVFGALAVARTILLVIIGMIMFRAGSLEEFANYLWGIVSRVNYGELTGGVLLCLGTDTPDFIVIGAGAVMMLIVGIMKERGTDVLQTVAKGPIYIKWSVMLGLIAVILVFGAYGPNYGPVDNIYAQF